MANLITQKFKNREVLGHPAGLFVLFFSEMWERMSYYGMRALLVLYMVKYLLPDPEKMSNVIGFTALKGLLEMGFGPLETQPFASEIYGLYTGFIYLSPFFGGILADRVWGKRKSVYVGGSLFIIGHFLMAFESMFLPALFFLILGNGAFKPNISSQVGTLYKTGDPRRDGAFTIFYMGINIGAFFSPFLCKNLANWICSYLGITDPGMPWHIGFALAGVGMILGLTVYHFGRGLLPEEPTVDLAPETEHRGILIKTVGGLLLGMTAFLAILALPSLIKLILIATIFAAIIWSILQIDDKLDRAKVTSLVLVCMGTVFFWAIFEQQGNTLQIWADEKADWARLGLQPENFQSFNPMFIFIFAPLLNTWWAFRAKSGKKSSSVRKMGMGCFIIGVAYMIIPLASNLITVDKSLTNLFWLALTTWIVTMGELYLSPIGLSFVSKVAPARFLSMMMGLWFMSSFLGNYLSGRLGTLYSTLSQTQFFLVFAGLGVTVGVFFLLAEKRMQSVVGKDV